MRRKYFIKTYGCQMNENDSETAAGLLEEMGYREAENEEAADVILVNTCVVRQKAEDRAAGYINSLKSLKKKRPGLIVGIMGCFSHREGENIAKLFPHVDITVGTSNVEMLPELLGHGGIAPLPHPKRKKSIQAWITIMQGCENYCSYCTVPYVRGKEISRKKEEILSEINSLDPKIFKEVVLLGQNVNSYKYKLEDLLKEVNDVNFIKRIRFLTSHPKDMREGIVKAVKDLDKVCESIHLPIQSGDDDILKAMNRNYSVADYMKIVEMIRKHIPGCAISSDLITGFPGETDKQFQNTLKVVEDIGFDLVITVAYSIRPLTAAAKLSGHLPEKVKQERLQELMGVVEKEALKKNQELFGRTVEVLVESASQGRTRTNKIVKFESDKKLYGELVNVKIDHASAWGLKGTLHLNKSKLADII